jgi:hypothetical protein
MNYTEAMKELKNGKKVTCCSASSYHVLFDKKTNRVMYVFHNGESVPLNIFDVSKSVIDSEWMVLKDE